MKSRYADFVNKYMRNIFLLFIIAVVILIWIFVSINNTSDEYVYGKSFRQNKIVNCIRLHKYGITGKGVTIGVLGAGFYTLHPAFEKMNIVKEFDFATNKPTTLNYDHVKGMDHGTNVLSVIGGYKENELIGIAYDANYILAKTDISTDRSFEEEINAVRGSNWLYENGADIITTSLSFNRFDDVDYYKPEQMNGNSTLICKTADSLFNKGVIYISSAGNKYNDKRWHIIETPGDGFNVLAVGSIDEKLNHSWFSSCGPTADGRIKPDLVALGEKVWTAHYLPKIKPDFWWNSGTSVSTPIVAGIAALVLSAHPELTARQVHEAIKMTASNSGNPDNLIGWGIPDAEKAVTYYGPAFSNTPVINLGDSEIEISTYVISSYGIDKASVEFHYFYSKSKDESVYKMIESTEDYFTQTISVSSDKQKLKFYFTAMDSRGYQTKYPSGIKVDFFEIN